MEGVELARFKGISLKVHPNWVFIIIFFTHISQAQFYRVFGDQFPLWQSWLVGFLTSLLLFFSVLLRELGHSFMAYKEGVKVYEITIFSLGGIKRIDKPCTTAMASLRIAIAGPLVNIALSSLCFSYIYFSTDLNLILLNMLWQLAICNFLLAIINLLPGLPLDGGVILKSLVWHFTGSQRKGNLAANASGRFFSLIVIFLGSFFAFAFKGGLFVGICLIVLGWFGLTSARSQDQMQVLQYALSDLSVKEAARRRFRVLEQEQTMKVLSDLRIQSSEGKTCLEWVLLCSAGRWVGYVTREILENIPPEHWGKYALSDFKKPLSDLPSISENDPLWHAVLVLEKGIGNRLLVLNLAGLPTGTIDKVDLAQILLKKIGLNLPPSFLEAARKNNSYPLGISLPKLVEGMISAGLIQKSELDKFTE